MKLHGYLLLWAVDIAIIRLTPNPATAPQRRDQRQIDHLGIDGQPAGASCCSSIGVGATAGFFIPPGFQHYNMASNFDAPEEKQLEKNRKAEKKAILLMQNIIGAEQCDVYRKTFIIIAKPSKWFWAIGNIFDSYREENPFYSKPDVIRLDNPKELHITYFCVEQNGGGPTPYTDKVIAFTVHLMKKEKSFMKTINRLGEKTLEKMPECAVFPVLK